MPNERAALDGHSRHRCPRDSDWCDGVICRDIGFADCPNADPPAGAESHRHECHLCDGAGCSECDNTGEKVTTMLDAGDGITARVHGSAPLTPESEEALRSVMRAAAKHMDGDDA